MNDLINDAYRQNLTLREAGMPAFRKLSAQLGIAVGSIFPANLRTLSGQHAQHRTKQKPHRLRPLSICSLPYGQWNSAFNLAWEVDFWGRFRRAIESADASLDYSVFNYDDVLVTLISDVATNYVIIRTAEEAIKYARDNVNLLQQAVTCALSRREVGVDNDLNLNQARSILYQTEAGIYELEITLRQATNQSVHSAQHSAGGLWPRSVPAAVAAPGVLVGIATDELRLQLEPGPIPVVARRRPSASPPTCSAAGPTWSQGRTPGRR